MKQPLSLILVASTVVIAFCASDNPSAPRDPAPRVRITHRTADSIAADPTTVEMARAQAVLHQLILGHPRREISHDLYQLIADDRVAIAYSDELTANFNNFAVTMCLEVGDRRAAALAISPTLLLEGYEGLAFQRMVIYHEYQHIRQVLDGRYPCETFIPTEIRNLTEDHVRNWIAAETEAYEAECLFANEIHSDVTLEFCLALERGGRQALRLEFARQMVGEPAPGLEWAAELITRIAHEPQP